MRTGCLAARGRQLDSVRQCQATSLQEAPVFGAA